MAFEQFQTQVLLLHSEQNTLDVLSSGFSDRYTVHCATSGIEALNTLGVTPIDVIVSAQDLPGMSGIDALREAKKRAPEMIAILMTGADSSDGIEAIVGDQEVFQIIRGEIAPDALFDLVESATKSARLVTLSESANDKSADVDSGPDIESVQATDATSTAFDDLEETGEHIVMETAENGACMISEVTGEVPVLRPEKATPVANTGARQVELLALTQDDEFLTTVREATRGMHKVHHAAQPGQAADFVRNFPIGVLVTDAAMAGTDVEDMTRQLRQQQPRLVAIVAGRRDDGDMLMDLINRGQVYRFLLKPVSPGRARLAIEASVKHHLDGPEHAFQSRPGPKKLSMPPPRPVRTEPKVVAEKPAAVAEQPARAPTPTPVEKFAKSSAPESLPDGLDEAFDEPNSFTETMTGIAVSIGKSVTVAATSLLGSKGQDEKQSSPDKPDAPGKSKAAATPADVPAVRKEPVMPKESPKPTKPEAVSATRANDGVDFDRTRRSKDFKPPEVKPETAKNEPLKKLPATKKPVESSAPAPHIEPPQSDPFAETGGGFKLPPTPVLAGIGAVVVAGIAASLYLLGGDETAATRPATQAATPTSRPALGAEQPAPEPAVVERQEQPVFNQPDAAPEPAGVAASPSPMSPQVAALLESANEALVNGELFAPAGQNAVELVYRAQALDPQNAAIAAQLETLVDDVYGQAETALLENRTQDASRALRVLGLADPNNQRLNFLSAQLNQQQLRLTLDDARDAIRAGRFEDAGQLLIRAESFAVADRSEIDALSSELSAERSEQQLDDVLELAAQRLADNQLLRPANDNARYYFELANTIQPGSAIAEQGLVTIAGRLVLRARTAIDNGEFDAAAALLDDARVMDPASEEVLSASAALDNAREAAVSQALSYDSVPQQRQSSPAVAAPQPSQSTPAASAPPTEQPAVTEPKQEAPAPDLAAQEATAQSAAEQDDPAPTPAVAEDRAVSLPDTSAAAGPEQVPALAMLTRSEPEADAGAEQSPAGSAEPEPEPAEANAEPEIQLVSITELNRTQYVAPRYPRSAERRQLSGHVDLIFTVTPLGTVSDIEIRNAVPGDTFVDSAMESVQNWEFEPVIEGGEAVPRRVAVRLTFNFE